MVARAENRVPEVRRILPPCRVCGDKAAGLHYGVNTCEACKGFFHRSLGRHWEYKCRENRTSGYCQYKPGKRKSCQFCRYKKCIDAGMSKDAIKTGRYSYHKRSEDTREVREQLQPAGFKDTSVSKEATDQKFLFSYRENSSIDSTSTASPPDTNWCTNTNLLYSIQAFPIKIDESESDPEPSLGEEFDLSPLDGANGVTNTFTNTVTLHDEIDFLESCEMEEVSPIIIHPFSFVVQNEASEDRKVLDTALSQLFPLDQSNTCQMSNITTQAGQSLANAYQVSTGCSTASMNFTPSNSTRSLSSTPSVNFTPSNGTRSPSFTPSVNFTPSNGTRSPSSAPSVNFTPPNGTRSPSSTQSVNFTPSKGTRSPSSTQSVDFTPSNGTRSPSSTQSVNFTPSNGTRSPSSTQSVNSTPSNGTRSPSSTQSVNFTPPNGTRSPISRSVSPLPSPDPAESFKTERPFFKYHAQPHYGNITLADVQYLYIDTNSIIRDLVASHRVNVGDFSYMPKDEMYRQQRAHYESCQLKASTFGTFKFLPEQEYDEIYSVTGMDVDNRRIILNNYLQRMERCVRGMVRFSKSIPGFSSLDLKTQVNLIKLARFEFSTFTLYPTVNLELGVTVGFSGRWTCQHDSDPMGEHMAVREYMRFCDKIQRLNPSEEEIVLLKAILMLTSDRDNSIKSQLAEEIHWQLCQCLQKVVCDRHPNPGIRMAKYIVALAESRTVAEHFNDVFRSLRMNKYSNIEQNPLLAEMYSTIINDQSDFPSPTATPENGNENLIF